MKTKNNISFTDSCLEAAKRFVQTAVVIDDEADYFDAASRPTTTDGTTIRAPIAGLTDSSDDEPKTPEENCINDLSAWDHRLDVDAIVNGFAKLKITCSVQRPVFNGQREAKELKEWALNCAGHADITIIDWSLCKDDLHLAGDIIIDLLKLDRDAGGRVRLVCVYTAQPNPRNILKDIKIKIIEQLNLPVSGNAQGLSCTVNDQIRIVILNKESSKFLNSHSIIVPFDELPETALKEFSALVNGLIPCAALHSIATVREKTLSLLALLNNELDGVFCAHRALIPNAEDSIDYMLNLIAQEITTQILCDKSARMFLDTDSIKIWYDERVLSAEHLKHEREALWEYLKNGGDNANNLRKIMVKIWARTKQLNKHKLKNDEGEDISYSEVDNLINKGAFSKIGGCSPPSPNNPDRIAELFYEKPKMAKKACNELSRLTCSSKDHSDFRKNNTNNGFLRLGSILRVENKDKEYVLCIQPSCDSVRLKENTYFLFLKLYSGKPGNTDFIIKLHDGSFQPLSVKTSNQKPCFKIYKFSPDKKSSRVLVNKLNRRYKWIAEIRPEKALMLSQKALSNASRIGLDEFELLRLKGSKLFL